MLAGDILLGRFVPLRLHRPLGLPLRLLLAVPFLVFPLTPPLALALPLIATATIGFAATLLLQQRLLALTPDELSGHALGLHASTLLTMQGVGATLAGAVAEATSPATAMGVLAAASMAVTLALQPGLRESRTHALGTGKPVGE
jgi:predicted MFS family arabinose efflux permease